MEFLDKTLNGYFEKLLGPRDARVRGWPLLDSYVPTAAVTALYFAFIWLGSACMRNRQPLGLRASMVVYNFLVTLLSVYMFVQLCVGAWQGNYSLKCQNTRSSGDVDVKVARVLWWYYFSKSIELMDTVFFVLRKKISQVSVLHVYHHATMLNIWWFVMNWIPTGHTFFGPMLNSFIHIMMYSYYGLAAIPAMQPYLWWKKYLTQAQLIQFVLTIGQTISAIVWPCGFSIPWLIFLTGYMISLTLFFINFYMKTYKKSRSRRHLKSREEEGDYNGYSNGHSITMETRTVVRKKVALD